MKTTSDQAEASTIIPARLSSSSSSKSPRPALATWGTPPHPVSSPACVATRREQLELVAGLAEADGECEDLSGFDAEHEVRIGEHSLFVFIVEGKIPVAHLVWPASIPLGRPHRGDAFERVLIGDPHGVAL